MFRSQWTGYLRTVFCKVCVQRTGLAHFGPLSVEKLRKDLEKLLLAAAPLDRLLINGCQLIS